MGVVPNLEPGDNAQYRWMYGIDVGHGCSQWRGPTFESDDVGRDVNTDHTL